MVGGLFNILHEFRHYGDPAILKCLLKFASPDVFVPDLEPIFKIADSHSKLKMLKGGSFKLTLNFKDYLPADIIDKKLVDALAFKEADKNDLMA